MNITQPHGEVILSSITNFVAEIPNATPSNADKDGSGPEVPTFGSFIKAESSEESFGIYAIVYNVTTQPYDSSHKPSALGLTRQELKVQQPHIFSLLQTLVHAQIIGFKKDTEIFMHLPPKPPQVHDFVFSLGSEEIRSITDNLDFLNLLLNVTGIPADELVAATIRSAAICTSSPDDFLLAAGKAVGNLYRDDYDKLVSVLKKIRT